LSRGGGQHLLELVSGPYRLPCELWEPERLGQEAGVSLVLCHGSTLKGMRHELIRHLARSLSARWPVLAFDLPGFGRAPRLVIERVDDYLFARHVLAAAKLAVELTGKPSVLVGHSMGGRVSLQAAAEGQRTGLVAGVITLAGLYELPTDPGEMLELVMDFASFVRVSFRMPMERLAEEVARLNPTRRAVEALEVPLLAVEGGREQYEFIRRSRYELFKAARCPKTLVLLGHADHKFKGCYDELTSILMSWLIGEFEGEKEGKRG